MRRVRAWGVLLLAAACGGGGGGGADTVRPDPGGIADVRDGFQAPEAPDPGPEAPPVCTPLCDARWCGQDDGCGGRCTRCPDNATCNTASWVCECPGTWCGYTCCREGQACGPGDTCLGCPEACGPKWCGQDDGCGGKCLRCPDNATCDTSSWVCDCPGSWCGNNCCLPGQRCGAGDVCEECVPDCSDRECGDDGCGGSCGTCLPGYECVDGTCRGCTADCSGRVCGDDGCGGSCGVCQAGYVCNEAGACERACNGKGFQGTVVEASWKPMDFLYGSGGNFVYTEETSSKEPYSQLVILFRQYSTYKGPTGPGTYAIPHKGFAECSTCILVFENCTATECERVYLADEGSIEIQSLDDANAPFDAVLHDVVLHEVQIGNDFSTTWVPNGRTWCLGGHHATAETVSLTVPQPECVAGGTGSTMDENIANFSLTNCSGQQVFLHDFCGQTKAVWIILVTAWCPYCAELVPQAAQYYEAHQPDVEVWVVLGEDLYGGSVDQQECTSYANGHGFPRARMFYDTGWQKLVQFLYPHYMTGVPYSIILDGDNMAYVWSSAYPGSENSVLNKLLND